MANLAHRAGQLLEKQYLIIHPTADGNSTVFFIIIFMLHWRKNESNGSPFFTATEKVHFQHTAKFISHLISEKANYTLQVRRWTCSWLCEEPFLTPYLHTGWLTEQKEQISIFHLHTVHSSRWTETALDQFKFSSHWLHICVHTYVKRATAFTNFFCRLQTHQLPLFKPVWIVVYGLHCLCLQIYPDEGHFLHSEGTQQHLSQSLVNFFEECFRVPEMLTDEQQENGEDGS